MAVVLGVGFRMSEDVEGNDIFDKRARVRMAFDILVPSFRQVVDVSDVVNVCIGVSVRDTIVQIVRVSGRIRTKDEADMVFRHVLEGIKITDVLFYAAFLVAMEVHEAERIKVGV